MKGFGDKSNTIVLGESLEALCRLPDGCVDLVYIDPPFNTGKQQTRLTLRTESAKGGSRLGFGGRAYRSSVVSKVSYEDKTADYLCFLRERLAHARRVLTPHASLFFHIDYREAHYCKVLLDDVFGRGSFMNEIIWAYDFGGRSKRRWPTKHDNIFWYAKDPKEYVFNYDEIERVPYIAPGLVGPEKAARGKVPTDVWWQTIVSTNGKEKTGYPNQKPLAVLRRIIGAHTGAGAHVLDFFAGSGTTGQAAAELGRTFLMIDDNHVAVEVMRARLGDYSPRFISL